MQLALYRSERPEVFEDIIGQKHIVRILQNQIRTGTVSQAYLFSGTHGTGKTSTARILAKAVNCMVGEPGTPGADLGEGRTIPCGHCANCEAIREGRFVDCIELDAASNNGVDDLRAIIEMVKYPPTVGRYKVDLMKERILEINPDANVEIYKEFYMADSKTDIITEELSYAVDCVDTIMAKIAIICKCDAINVPVISSMGTGNKLDPTMFEVADIYETSVCPLARIMKKDLKKRLSANSKTTKILFCLPQAHFGRVSVLKASPYLI